jgi:hypothetical protein
MEAEGETEAKHKINTNRHPSVYSFSLKAESLIYVTSAFAAELRG